jgi:hypothetical protein
MTNRYSTPSGGIGNTISAVAGQGLTESGMDRSLAFMIARIAGDAKVQLICDIKSEFSCPGDTFWE